MLVDVDHGGVGGADPARGSGLSGRADRVHALDGELEIESPAGHGSHLRAAIPCAYRSRTTRRCSAQGWRPPLGQPLLDLPATPMDNRRVQAVLAYLRER